MLQNIDISNKCCSFEKCIMVCHKKLFSLVIIRNVFDQQISILERFLKDHVMLESGVIMLKPLALPAQD